MRVRVASHRYADLILERQFEVEWAEIRNAIARIRMPVRSSGQSLWSRFRSELISSLTRLAWVPDLPVPAWHQTRAESQLHVDLEKRGVIVMVANEGRDLYADLFALGAAAAGEADVGVYVVGTATLTRGSQSAVPTLEDVALPLRYRLGGIAMPVAIVGIQPTGRHHSDTVLHMSSATS